MVVKFTIPASMSGTILMDLIFALLTGSIQTVCQIPVTEVYQIPRGLLTCFPRGWVPESTGSHTDRTSSCSPVSFKASVISNVKESYPPR